METKNMQPNAKLHAYNFQNVKEIDIIIELKDATYYDIIFEGDGDVYYRRRYATRYPIDKKIQIPVVSFLPITEGKLYIHTNSRCVPKVKVVNNLKKDIISVSQIPSEFSNNDLSNIMEISKLLKGIKNKSTLTEYVIKNESIYPDGRVEKSHFSVFFVPYIYRRDGTNSSPAMTFKRTGDIFISTEHFKRYPLYERIAIVCHEYAHSFLNFNFHSELEADSNGAKLFIALGLPAYSFMRGFIIVLNNSIFLRSNYLPNIVGLLKRSYKKRLDNIYATLKKIDNKTL